MSSFPIVSPCPYCGKQPKFRWEMFNVDGYFGKLHCKPFFRKAHIKAIGGSLSSKRAIDNIIDCWEEQVLKHKILKSLKKNKT